MLRTLYSLAMWMAQPLVRRKLRRRARSEPRYAHAVEQRFGYYDLAQQDQGRDKPLVWVHAVSLGETRAAAVLIAGLRVRVPGMRLLLTHGTATGWEQGTALLQAGDVQAWQPWDTPAAVQRFLAQFRPRMGLLMETEVWPNLVAACAKAKIPLCLVNARMSEKSFHQARRLSWLSHGAYRDLATVLAQTEDDATRLRKLGATVQGVTGNLKFDASVDAAQLARGRSWHAASARPVLLFASSREGEEQMLLAVLQRKESQAVQWLIVPRHPQRFDEVAALLEAGGLQVSRRSTWQDQPHQADVWLGDSLGEMTLYYGMADLALLGGSFAPLGGQNLIEAAACSCPVVAGPHTFNFAQAAEMAVEAGAAFRCTDLEGAVTTALQTVANPAALETARHNALQWSQSHRGATGRTLDALAGYLAG
jgi:3-deoxy-D-manno-octulosonic-acid transferase